MPARLRQRPSRTSSGGSPNGEDVNRTYHDAAQEPKTLWEIPESDHMGGLEARPQEYERRVVGFFDDALR